MGDTKKFLRRVLESGIDTGNLSPDDILEDVTLDILVSHLPVSVKAKLIRASLESATMTHKLVVTTVGVDTFAEHMPAPTVWACIERVVTRGFDGKEPAEAASASASPAKTSGNGSIRRRGTRPPPPPGAREAITDAEISAAAPSERKPNVGAPAGAAGAVSRRQGRPGTLDRALDALEIDDSVFAEKTRTGESQTPLPELLNPERTDVREQRTDWPDDDTNPGGARGR